MERLWSRCSSIGNVHENVYGSIGSTAVAIAGEGTNRKSEQQERMRGQMEGNNQNNRDNYMPQEIPIPGVSDTNDVVQQDQSNPYGRQTQNDSYGQQMQNSPYGQTQSDPYWQQTQNNPYGQPQSDPYWQQAQSNPYGPVSYKHLTLPTT
ncbi:MAG: hypothetical protein K2J99_04705 [Lachnospiraceae bacterium]|nr:hypothetical protein [Lachnospiraceae bacterium]